MSLTVNKVGGGNEDYSYQAAIINARIESLSNSIPDVTKTKDEKERAIKVKDEIIRAKLELIALAQKSNPSAVEALRNELEIIKGEKATIQGELAAMTSIFDKDAKFTNNDSSIFLKKETT